MKPLYRHQPVLLAEVIEHLSIQPSGIYLDATFGRGGHSAAILDRLGPNGRLFAMDQDPRVETLLRESESMSAFADPRFCFERGRFSMLEQYANEHDVNGQVNGILLDLGVSSPQFDDPERGFSFMREGPLDMRMDPSKGMSAKQWINEAAEQEIADVLKTYGEERFSKRIAYAIVNQRVQAPIDTTTELAALIAKANPVHEKNKHPATRSFQAIRIFINRELDELRTVLDQCLSVLAVGGRLLVISFHSLEDRIVKRFIRQHVRGETLPSHIPVRHAQLRQRLKSVGRAIKPGPEEVEQNPRARSAVLRVAEKTS